MAAATLIVLFGAAVRADGRPSLALARRIAYAAKAADDNPQADVLCSGGTGRVGPSEASVMATELAKRGVAADRLILDEASLDTLQSVLEAAAWVRAGGYGRLIACSDAYHLPRIRALFTALGLSTEAGPTLRRQGGAHRVYMAAREAAALPYDVAIVLTHRVRLLAQVAARARALAESSA